MKGGSPTVNGPRSWEKIKITGSPGTRGNKDSASLGRGVRLAQAANEKEGESVT